MAKQERIRINEKIRATELRVIGPTGENFGVIPTSEALKKAQELELDLIEISPNATPPIAKIMDFGKYQYIENKKMKEQKAKVQITETKSLQIKVATGENDLMLKAKKASEWLNDGHRVKMELFLSGRSKYLDKKFLEERLNRILVLISTPYKVSDPVKKSPKGLVMVLEKQR